MSYEREFSTWWEENQRNKMEKPPDIYEKYVAWQQRLCKLLPALTKRVFDLRGKSYKGSGFHYSLENTLGRVISIANDWKGQPLDVSQQVARKVVVTALFNRLHNIETELQREVK